MSYCVNCGVELDKTASKCALCGVPVINPLQPVDETSPKPFPNNDFVLYDRNVKLISVIASVILAFPSILCILANVIFSPPGLIWAVYPIGAFIIVWVFTVPPTLMQMKFPGRVAVTLPGILVYLYIIEVFSPTKGWFLAVAVPITVASGVYLIIISFLRIKRILKGLNFAAAAVVGAGILVLIIELIIDISIEKNLSLSWSILTFTCLSGIALILIAAEHNERSHQEVRKRLHF